MTFGTTGSNGALSCPPPQRHAIQSAGELMSNVGRVKLTSLIFKPRYPPVRWTLLFQLVLF